MARVFKSKSELQAEAKSKRAAANILDKEVKKSKSVIKQWNKQGKNGELGHQAYGCLVLAEQFKIQTLEKLVKKLRDEANKDYLVSVWSQLMCAEDSSNIA